MAKMEMPYTQHYDEVLRMMTSRGLLLGSYDASDKPNVMTIGWGSMGSIWGLPLWMVLVRPSRYTYQCIEHSGAFSVNVPTPQMAHDLAFCGTRSGRDLDKFAACALTAHKAENVAAPTVAECPIIYECDVVHHNDVVPDALADEIQSGAYPQGDYHRVYFGRIRRATAEPDAVDLLTQG